MTGRLTLLAAVLAGCGAELPPPREQDVVRALVDDFLAPMGDVLVVGTRSDCNSAGETDAAVPATLFAAFLNANAPVSTALDLRPHASRLRVDGSGASPYALRAKHREPVVALSRVGIAGSQAIVCVEVFGVQERGFFLLLARDRAGEWMPTSEVVAWRPDPAPKAIEPEELPDGTLYERR